MDQMHIDFTPGLMETFPDLDALIVNSAHTCGRPMKHLAADMEWSPSELSRRLSGELPFPANRLDDWIAATGDKRIPQWFALKHLGDPADAAQRALRAIAAMAPTFIALAQVAGISSQLPAPAAKARR